MVKNRKEFEELASRYENIEQIIHDYFEGAVPKKIDNYVKNKLTGFGDTLTCTLCKPILTNCHYCVYDVGFASASCNSGDNEATYYAIVNSYTTEGYIKACHARADRMREILAKDEEKPTIHVVVSYGEGVGTSIVKEIAVVPEVKKRKNPVRLTRILAYLLMKRRVIIESRASLATRVEIHIRTLDELANPLRLAQEVLSFKKRCAEKYLMSNIGKERFRNDINNLTERVAAMNEQIKISQYIVIDATRQIKGIDTRLLKLNEFIKKVQREIDQAR